MNSVSTTINALNKLREYILSEPNELNEIMQVAKQHNGWFSIDNQKMALTSIANKYLERDKLQQFVAQYDIPVKVPKRIAIIMAGNIPLVGFHDVICVLLAGHTAVCKLSSKDNKLMKAILLKLKGLTEELNNRIEIVDNQLKQFDAVIATGSDNTSRYFEEYFGRYPNIIRKNRNSIAILSGNETEDQLRKLGYDIFNYFGLGCRNVAKLFVPEGYDFTEFLEITKKFSNVILNTKYKNNLDYNLTLLILNKIPYLSNDILILTNDESLHSRISIIHYQEYSTIEEVNNWIIDNNEKLQVVIGNEYTPFGSAQHPSLEDFADNVNTMQFLENL